MKQIAYLTNFSYLDATLNIQKNLLEEFSKKFKKIYFINSQNLRYFQNFAKKQFDEKSVNFKFKSSKKFIFFNPKNEKEFRNFIKNKNLLIINNFGRNFWTLKTFFLLKKYNLKHIHIDALGGVGMSANFVLKNPIKYLNYVFFQSLIKKIILPLLLLLKIIPRSEISFVTKRKEISFTKKNIIKKFLYKNKLLYSKKYILVNSRSHDYFLENRQRSGDKYIVHLDIEMNGRHEIETRGRLGHKEINSHYYHLRNFLKNLSSSYKKRVIVCIHPGVKKKDVDKLKKSKLLNGFKIVQFNTRKYIYNAFIVTTFDTSAIVDAAILKKRIIGLWSRYMDENQIEHSKTYPNIIGYLRVNFENYSFNKKKLLRILNSRIIKYNNFINNYHTFEKGIKGSSQIISILKKDFNCV